MVHLNWTRIVDAYKDVILINMKTRQDIVIGVIKVVWVVMGLLHSSVIYVVLGIICIEMSVIKIYVQDQHMLLTTIIECVSYVNGVVKYVLHRIIVVYVREDLNCIKVGVISIVHSIPFNIWICIQLRWDVDNVVKNGSIVYHAQVVTVKVVMVHIRSVMSTA